MSASTIVTLRLDHLDKSAQSLAITSPAISGHLRSAQHRLASGEGRPISTPDHLRLCKACGSSLILGWNCEVAKDSKSKKKRTRQDRLQKQSGPKTINVRCSRCDSVNTIDSLKSKPVKEELPERKMPMAAQSAKPSIPHRLDEPRVQPKVQPSAPRPAAPAAKKRIRGKNSSLQSMLENRKPTTTQAKGFGLDLADFMKG